MKENMLVNSIKKTSKVSIIKCESYNQDLVYETIKKSLEAIGYVLPSKRKVLLKPNLLSATGPNENITTHPAIVEAVCRLLKERNCEIVIGDSSGLVEKKGTLRAFSASGIKEVTEKYGKIIPFEEEPSVTISNPTGKILKTLHIAKEVHDAGYIINLPKIKTHVLTKYTGAIKNLFGCVPGALKQKYHIIGGTEEGFCQLLVDIYENVKPQLTIMDAVYGMEGAGPGPSGKSKKLGLIIVSENGAALDYVATQIIGYNPMDVLTNKYAAKRGLFRPEDIEVIGKMIRVDFEKPIIAKVLPFGVFSKIYREFSKQKPVLNKKNCTKCGLCSRVCPVNVIKMSPYPEFDYSKCITCYCCHENCPNSAIKLRRSRMIDAVEKIVTKFMGEK